MRVIVCYFGLQIHCFLPMCCTVIPQIQSIQNPIRNLNSWLNLVKTAFSKLVCQMDSYLQLILGFYWNAISSGLWLSLILFIWLLASIYICNLLHAYVDIHLLYMGSCMEITQAELQIYRRFLFHFSDIHKDLLINQYKALVWVFHFLRGEYYNSCECNVTVFW